jgi:hypothetical protein
MDQYPGKRLPKVEENENRAVFVREWWPGSDSGLMGRCKETSVGSARWMSMASGAGADGVIHKRPT